MALLLLLMMMVGALDGPTMVESQPRKKLPGSATNSVGRNPPPSIRVIETISAPPPMPMPPPVITYRTETFRPPAVPRPPLVPAPPPDWAIAKQPKLEKFYPTDLRKARVEGVSTVNLAFDATGKVDSCRVRPAPDAGPFDTAACAAGVKFRFRPFGHHGGSVAVRIVWRLDGVKLVRAVRFTGPKLLNDEELFNPDDYPAPALRREQQGATTVRLSVDTSGRPNECVIYGSSGSVYLDQASCSVMMRSRYASALDEFGTPISGSVMRRIVWRLPDDVPDQGAGSYSPRVNGSSPN